MTPENFCYWLQGFSEISGRTPTEKEWIEIQNHLKLVFSKVTPVQPGVKSKPYDLNPDWKKIFEEADKNKTPKWPAYPGTDIRFGPAVC